LVEKGEAGLGRIFEVTYLFQSVSQNADADVDVADVQALLLLQRSISRHCPMVSILVM
jgi:hypothetical protein